MTQELIDRDELCRRLTKNIIIRDIDVSTTDIGGIKFNGKKVVNVVFSRKESPSLLKDVSFEQAELERCSFYMAELRDCLFKKAFINSTSFEKCDLIYCNFDSAFLRDVRFSRSKISESRFREADLQWIDFRYVEVSRVTFQDASMKGCDFYRAEFLGINVFDDSSIMDASLNKTLLEGAGIRMDNLYYGILQESEKIYQKHQEKWAKLLSREEMFEFATNGVLQEDSDNFKLYHHRWAEVRQYYDEQYKLSEKRIHVFLKERFWEAMQVYRLLHASWVSKGYMRDAAWAYIKLKRLEIKSCLPNYAWVIYGRKVPEFIGERKYRKTLKAIRQEYDKKSFKACYMQKPAGQGWYLKENLKSEDHVHLREIFVWYRLPPLFSWWNRYKKLPKLLGYFFIDLICGFGESLLRVSLSFVALIFILSLYTVLSDGIVTTTGDSLSVIDHLLFSLRNLTNTNPKEIVAANKATELLISIQVILGIVLVGLFGFVLGNTIRNR